MATLEELYTKIVSDDAEKRAFAEAFATEEGAAAFMEQRGCDASPVELVALMREKTRACEMSDNELENAAGGKTWDWIPGSILFAGIGAIGDVSEIVAAYAFLQNPHSDIESVLDMCNKVRPA